MDLGIIAQLSIFYSIYKFDYIFSTELQPKVAVSNITIGVYQKKGKIISLILKAYFRLQGEEWKYYWHFMLLVGCSWQGYPFP
jgi:hypothetical protein